MLKKSDPLRVSFGGPASPRKRYGWKAGIRSLPAIALSRLRAIALRRAGAKVGPPLFALTSFHVRYAHEIPPFPL